MSHVLKLDRISEDELRIILSFLGKKELKCLRLVNKRLAKSVTKYDKRVQTWSIQLYEDEFFYQYFDVLSKSKTNTYFNYIKMKLNLGYEVGPEVKELMLEGCRDQIQTLEIDVNDGDVFLRNLVLPNLKELHITIIDEELEDISASFINNHPALQSLNFDGFVEEIEIRDSFAHLKTLEFDGCTPEFVTRMLNNDTITAAATSLTVWNCNGSEGEEVDERCVPNLQNLVLNECDVRFTKLISSNLYSLVMLSCQYEIDLDSLPDLSHLRVVMVDESSVQLLHKVRYVDTMMLSCYGSNTTIPTDSLFPRLKHLIFGSQFVPDIDFMLKHKSRLETIGMAGIENTFDLSNFNIKDFPALKRLLLPLEREGQVVDDSGRVDVVYNRVVEVKDDYGRKVMFKTDVDKVLKIITKPAPVTFQWFSSYFD